VAFLLMANLFNVSFAVSWPEIFTNIFYEIVLTTAVFFFFYLFTRLFFKRLNPKFISRHQTYAIKRSV
jgi:hypothetical protein